ncbi:hypothetical protein ACUN9V_19780 [Salinicola sp. V024]|uniref:hypothetical protein n=1 Tax=Salinicola sp. V024 TaxID=3459609 RepID=UPI0040446409
MKLNPFIQRADGSTRENFTLLALKICKVYDKRVEVYGLPKLTAHSLINAASQFITIEGDCWWIDELMGVLSASRRQAPLRLKVFSQYQLSGSSG